MTRRRLTKAPGVLLTLFTLFTASCGGGSSGTGGRELDGVVEKGTVPLTDVVITTLPPTDSDMTDAQGHFSLHNLPYDSSLHLRFESPSSVVLVDLENIPDGTESIDMQCNYDEASGSFEVTTTHYIDENGVSTDGRGVVVLVDEKSEPSSQ